MANMQPTKKLFVALGHLKSFSNTTEKNILRSTEYNMANLLAQNMFKNYHSSLLRQQTVNQYFFVFYRVQ
jgi:hypothetical protein